MQYKYMNDAFFLGLLIFLQFSIFVSIQFARSYISNRTASSYNRIRIAIIINVLTGLLTLFLMIHNPEVVSKFQIQSMMVLESGLIFFFLVYIKSRIAIRVIKRSKDTNYYDISFFGKKVYKPEVVKKSEVAIFIVTMPFTVITGAYFLANIFI